MNSKLSFLRRVFATGQARKQTPQTYGSFEQSFHIPPRYFMVKYKLKEDFAELKAQYEDEHNAAVKRKFDD